jgi:hypothetical protein
VVLFRARALIGDSQSGQSRRTVTIECPRNAALVERAPIPTSDDFRSTAIRWRYASGASLPDAGQPASAADGAWRLSMSRRSCR